MKLSSTFTLTSFNYKLTEIYRPETSKLRTQLTQHLIPCQKVLPPLFLHYGGHQILMDIFTHCPFSPAELSGSLNLSFLSTIHFSLSHFCKSLNKVIKLHSFFHPFHFIKRCSFQNLMLTSQFSRCQLKSYKKRH
jgi:hypothetical protein